MIDFLVKESHHSMQNHIIIKYGLCFCKNAGLRSLVVLNKYKLEVQRKDLLL